MKDLAIELANRPGALAEMGEALGKAGVSVEGGAAWVVDGIGVAHFLFDGHSCDHDNQLILVVDDIEKARAVSREWSNEGT